MAVETQEARPTFEHSLPRDAYVSEAHFQREREQFFYREWFCVGREEALPNPGDYLHVDVVGERILIVRTRTGDLCAHYNVCRHRGSRLVLDQPSVATCAAVTASGAFAGVIHCPYHAWSYELDGRVRNAPFLGDAPDFHKSEFSLHSVGLDTWGGFIFVNLSPHEAQARNYTLMTQLDRIPHKLGNYPLADLRTAQRLVYEVDSNWKVIAENYNECYHCGPVHPELCKIVPAFKKNGGIDLDWEHGIIQAEGTHTYTFSGTTDRAPFPDLALEEQTRHNGQLTYPNMMISLSADHVAAFMLLPHSAGKTTVVCDFLFHPSEMAKPTFDPSDAVEFWDLVNKQDWIICAAVQSGMGSRSYRYGYYAPMEDASLDIRRYLAQRMGGLPEEIA